MTNTFNSNVAWSKKFKGAISTNLSVNLRHSQNSNSGLMTFNLPEIAYNVNRFYPFKMLRKNSINNEKTTMVLAKILKELRLSGKRE